MGGERWGDCRVYWSAGLRSGSGGSDPTHVGCYGEGAADVSPHSSKRVESKH
jgi:hypothetical protein